MKLFRKIIFAAAVCAPSHVFACAACYGRADSPLAEGMNWGILTLLGVIVSVLSCIALFFVHVIRKEDALNKSASKNPPEV